MEGKKDRDRQEHLAVCVFDDHKGKLGQRVQDAVDRFVRNCDRTINYSAEQYSDRHPIKTIRYVFDIVIEDSDLDLAMPMLLNAMLASHLQGYVYMTDSKYSNADVVEILAFFNRNASV